MGMLVNRDIEAFISKDLSMVADDFIEEAFIGDGISATLMVGYSAFRILNHKTGTDDSIKLFLTGYIKF